MKLTLMTIALFCLATSLYAQSAGQAKINHSPDVLKRFLDPDYPVFKEVEDKLFNELNYKAAMKKYAALHKPFPVYKNNGNKRKDQKLYQLAKEKWFDQNPYFPQYIKTGYPEIDKENYERAKREWIKRYPDEYKALFEVVYNDNELLEQYYFIID